VVSLYIAVKAKLFFRFRIHHVPEIFIGKHAEVILVQFEYVRHEINMVLLCLLRRIMVVPIGRMMLERVAGWSPSGGQKTGIVVPETRVIVRTCNAPMQSLSTKWENSKSDRKIFLNTREYNVRNLAQIIGLGPLEDVVQVHVRIKLLIASTLLLKDESHGHFEILEISHDLCFSAPKRRENVECFQLINKILSQKSIVTFPQN
jgi:hypothetical protein